MFRAGRYCDSPDSIDAAIERQRRKNSYRRLIDEIDRLEVINIDIHRANSLIVMTVSDHDRKIIIDFCHLLEKSKQFFNGLRELPPYGHQQWYSYFGRTFDVYTKLWKYQQEHRHILDSYYGLKRWQIGEIASKIGQLYYHFYLRTSNTVYLLEAFSFYLSIRTREYYTLAGTEETCDVMVKKLRYYARFIVVCLLLRKMALVRELIKELDCIILEYGDIYNPHDQREWMMVLHEARSFLKSDGLLVVTSGDNVPRIISHRLEPRTTPRVDLSPNTLRLILAEILIVGSCFYQTKFSEMTVDMYRMVQTLEKNPPEEFHSLFDGSPRARGLPMPPLSSRNNNDYRENAHKLLLFMPNISQVLVYLSSGCKDLPINGALLFYVSGDGCYDATSRNPEDGFSTGGIITGYESENQETPARRPRVMNCLYPGDLYPFTRCPMFLIIDSDNSIAFQDLKSFFGHPMVVLMSPVQIPTPLCDVQFHGNLFTLFLHSPLTAFCLCTGIPNLSATQWERGQSVIDRFLVEAARLLVRFRIDLAFMAFMGDEYLRLLLLRYIFCEVVLRMHRAFTSRAHLPTASPALPEAELLEASSLFNIIWDLVYMLHVDHHFVEEKPVAAPKATKEE